MEIFDLANEIYLHLLTSAKEMVNYPRSTRPLQKTLSSAVDLIQLQYAPLITQYTEQNGYEKPMRLLLSQSTTSTHKTSAPTHHHNKTSRILCFAFFFL